MVAGRFISLVIPYMKDNVFVPAEEQAEDILKQAKDLVVDGAPGVAITYSANYGQTRDIQQVYFSGGWNTGTVGENQADVMRTLESLLGTKYQTLQGKVRIVPITTMNAYVDPVDPWNDDVLLGIVTTDLDRIRIYLECGWNVLGWQNQTTVGDPKHPYAVGGGIARLPNAVAGKIQSALIAYAAAYAK